MRVGIKAAWIGGSCLILATIITAIIANSKKSRNNSSIQSVDHQKVDTGSINNYNAGRDVKIENNIYNAVPKDTQTTKPLKNESRTTVVYQKNKKEKSDTTKPQVKNQIVNNAPNQGVQINEVKGNVYLKEPEPPLQDHIISILNSINPIILQKYKSGENPICVMISDWKISKLMPLRSQLEQNYLLRIESTGSVNFGHNNRIGNCINDLDEGSLKGFRLLFLDNFKL